MLLRKLEHPHIVSYKTSFFDKGELIIIMEFCESKLFPVIIFILLNRALSINSGWSGESSEEGQEG